MSVNLGMIFFFQIKYVINRNRFLCRKQLFRKRGQRTECDTGQDSVRASKISTVATDFLPLPCIIHCRTGEKQMLQLSTQLSHLIQTE